MSENKSTTIYNMKHDIAQILLEDVIKKDPEVIGFWIMSLMKHHII